MSPEPPHGIERAPANQTLIEGRNTARSVVPSPSKSPGGIITTGLTVTNWFPVVRKAVIDTALKLADTTTLVWTPGGAPVSTVGTRSVTIGNVIRHRPPVDSSSDPLPPGGVSRNLPAVVSTTDQAPLQLVFPAPVPVPVPVGDWNTAASVPAAQSWVVLPHAG